MSDSGPLLIFSSSNRIYLFAVLGGWLTSSLCGSVVRHERCLAPLYRQSVEPRFLRDDTFFEAAAR